MSYEIADEPVETPWRHLVVNPSAPLLAMMLAGSWLAFPWFAFNAYAIGSPTRRKELALCVAAFVVSGALGVVVLALREGGALESRAALQLALLGISAWKLGIAYAIHQLQSRTFHVYEYYGGSVRSASYLLSTGLMMRGAVLGFVDDPLWVIIVSGGLSFGAG